MDWKGIFSILFIGTLFWGFAGQAAAESKGPHAPQTPHCVGSGPLGPFEPLPLDADFCGCTWGAVYYRGKPVFNAPVNLHFDNQTLSAVSKAHPEPEPEAYYILIGNTLGAKKGDVMQVDVTFAGQTVGRAFHAWPDGTGEQEVPLVIPERGSWASSSVIGYTNVLAVDGETLWAGGPSGLVTINLATNEPVVQPLPWIDQTVIGIAVVEAGRVWAVGPHTLAEWDGTTWHNRTPPFAATLRAVAIDSATGDLWLGGGDQQGALAMYDGSWHPVTAVAEEIRTLAVDGQGDLWVGTQGGGAYRRDQTVSDLDDGWQQYKVSDGLASDYLAAIAADATNVWFGTLPYVDGQGKRGGISRYNLTTDTWESYTSAHGLPADNLGAAAPIYALALDAQGAPWAGTSTGIQLLAAPGSWVTDLVTGNAVRTLAVKEDLVLAARASGQLLQLDQSITPGNPPTAQITSASTLTVSQAAAFTLAASATDNDGSPTEVGQQILAWEWLVDGQPLCTTAGVCTMPASILSVGTHTVSLQVQDDEGVWSSPTTSVVVVTQPLAVYLPVIKAALAQ